MPISDLSDMEAETEGGIHRGDQNKEKEDFNHVRCSKH